MHDEPTNTLVHMLVASRVDYCCSLLFRSLRTVTDKLQRVLHAAARVATNTLKYDRGLHHTMLFLTFVSCLLTVTLHIVDVRLTCLINITYL